MKISSVFSFLLLSFVAFSIVYAEETPTWGDTEESSNDTPSWDDSKPATDDGDDTPSWDDAKPATEDSTDTPSWDDSKTGEDGGESPSWGGDEEKSNENEGIAWSGDEKEKKESGFSDNAFKLGVHLLTFSYKKIYSPKPDSVVSFDLIKGGFLYFGYQLKKHMEFGLNFWIGSDGSDPLFDGDSAFKLILAPYFQENIEFTKNLSLPLQISLGFSVLRGDFKATNFIVSPAIGLQYRFHKHASFDFMFRISYDTGKFVGKKFDYKYDNNLITIFPTTGFTVWF